MGIDENDILTYHLYAASRNPSIKKGRIISQVGFTLAFLALAGVFYDNDIQYLAVYFLVLAVLAILFYPLYLRWYYKRHYRKFIRNTYKNQLGKESRTEITEEAISIKDHVMNMTFNTSEITEIHEIRDYYFIKLRGSPIAIIIAKAKEENREEIKKTLQSLIVSKNIKHIVDLDWKWK